MFLVSADELRQLVPMADAIDAVAAAFASAERSTEEPLRMVTSDGNALAMVARRPPSEVTAGGTSFKLVTVWEPNRRRNLPTIHALAVWFDGDHQPRLLVEGASLTALRTGATTGVATRILAARTASKLAMIGAGGQAADQIRGVHAVRDIDEVRIFSRSSASASLLVERLAPELPDVRLCRASSAAQAVEGADVICCATTSRDPVIQTESVGDCVHINAIGAYRPDMCELPPELFGRADVVAVDSIHGAKHEAGDVMAALSRGLLAPSAVAEIGTLVAAQPRSARLTIFKSVGSATQDWAICHLLSTRVASTTRSVDLSSAG